MTKTINGQRWYCCPHCGKKLFPLTENAYCRGVIGFCRHCKWEGEIII